MTDAVHLRIYRISASFFPRARRSSAFRFARSSLHNAEYSCGGLGIARRGEATCACCGVSSTGLLRSLESGSKLGWTYPWCESSSNSLRARLRLERARRGCGDASFILKRGASKCVGCCWLRGGTQYLLLFGGVLALALLAVGFALSGSTDIMLNNTPTPDLSVTK